MVIASGSQAEYKVMRSKNDLPKGMDIDIGAVKTIADGSGRKIYSRF